MSSCPSRRQDLLTDLPGTGHGSSQQEGDSRHKNRFYGQLGPTSPASGSNRWRGEGVNCDEVIADNDNYMYLSVIFSLI